MTYITVPDMNDSVSYISIDGRGYYLRFTYNERLDYWSFGVLDGKKNPIVAMTKVVPNFPLMHQYTDIALPNGIFGCISNEKTIGRYAFRDGLAQFVYIPGE